MEKEKHNKSYKLTNECVIQEEHSFPDANGVTNVHFSLPQLHLFVLSGNRIMLFKENAVNFKPFPNDECTEALSKFKDLIKSSSGKFQ